LPAVLVLRSWEDRHQGGVARKRLKRKIESPFRAQVLEFGNENDIFDDAAETVLSNTSIRMRTIKKGVLLNGE